MNLRRGPGASSFRRLRLPHVGRFVAGFLAVTLVAATRPGVVVGQEDFRNTDRGRPLFTEDAYPIELREWELELGGRGRLVEGGTGSGAGAAIGLKTGLFLNTQVGLEVETALEQSSAGTGTGFAGVGASLMHGLRRETWRWPALAVRADAHAPGGGDVGRDDWAFDVTGIATRSFGRLRMHANAGRRFGEGAGGDDWRAGLAVDYPIGLFSRLVMADVYTEVPTDRGRSRVWLELGTRWQLTNASVIDVGLATRLDEWEAGRSNFELTLGFARAFGISTLVAVPSYPRPDLD